MFLGRSTTNLAARFRLNAGGTLAAVALTLAACGGDATGLGLNLVPAGQVEAMGVDAWRELRAETPPSRNAAYQQRADRVASRILAATGRDPAAWEVVVFRGEEANAFALPGGKIGVYEGMMEVAETDDELAAVIAHEIAHNEAGHPAERLNSAMAADLGLNIASAVLGAADVAQPRAIAGLLGAGVQYGMILPYSRNQEFEADRLGLRYTAQAGYDPRATLAFWEKMRRQGARPPAFLSTHPAPEQRIERIQALLPEAVAVYQAAR